MGYKIDPITGQMIKSESDQSQPTTKQWNPKDYIGYSKDFDKQSPEVSKLDSIVPVKSQQLDDLAPKSAEQYRMDALRNLMRSPASMDNSINDQKNKNQEDFMKYLNRPASREEEPDDLSDNDMAKIQRGSPAWENRILAQGRMYSPEQSNQLDEIQNRAGALDETPDKGGAEREAIDSKYEELNNFFKNQNRNEYWKNK
jgi:hypothetical protein